MSGRRTLSMVVCAGLMSLAALPAPPAVAAAPSWQLIADPAPGATGLDGSVETPPRVAFTVAGGEPYLAVVSRQGDSELRVYRAVRNRTWRELSSGPLNAPAAVVGSVDLTAVGETAWIAWNEQPGSGASELHVARLTRSGVRELPGSPIDSAAAPQIAYFGGRLYVAYAGPDGMHAVRTRATGRGFERIESFDHTPAAPEEMGVDRGRLYLSDFESNTTLYSILNRRATGWLQVDDPPSDLFVPRIGGTTFSHTHEGGEGPGAPNFVRLFATRHGVAEELPSPATPGDDVPRMDLLVADGTLWALWVEGGPSDMAPPRVPHVARLIRR